MAQLTIPILRLHDDIEIPQLGVGASYLLPADTQQLLEIALEAGYRHIDLTAGRGNEEGVAAALASSGLPREDYFVTAKLCDPAPSLGSTLNAFESSLARLGLDHVDLYLLDRPTSSGFVEAWRAFEEIRREEAARTIGVSNFRIEDLELLERERETRPTVNQVEIHPWFQQSGLRAWHAGHDIITSARSPVAQGVLLDDETVVSIAKDHGMTPIQVTLRWHVQLGHAAIPKLVTAERIREGIGSLDFELTAAEMAALDGLERGMRIGPDPAEFIAP